MQFGDVSIGLRNLIHARNWTYKQLAAKLKMSESGVKKLLTSSDISFNKLNLILNMLETTMEELISMQGKRYSKLSESQEVFFLKNPSCYNFFIQWHHSKSDMHLLKKENPKLSKAKIENYLKQLRSIGILEESGGKIRSTLQDGFLAGEKLDIYLLNRVSQVMEKARHDKGLRQRASWQFEGLGSFSLTQKSALEYQAALRILLDEFSTRSERERTLYSREKLVTVGSLLLSLPIRLRELYPI